MPGLHLPWVRAITSFTNVRTCFRHRRWLRATAYVFTL